VLLIDEIDKSDIDLPNDLLNIFEEGEFEIPELSRLARAEVWVRPYEGGPKVLIPNGRVHCKAFPFVVLTNNGEREFPPAFLRRCLRLDMTYPTEDQLKQIVTAHLGKQTMAKAEQLIRDFVLLREKGDLATDQLLNAVHLATSGISFVTDGATAQTGTRSKLVSAVLRYLKG
jgi:MoxR-like ATPase